jgi:hypothetical protein
MKTLKKYPVLLALLVIILWVAHATAENKTEPLPVKINSIFIVPSGTKDGRDPFFPESTRTFVDQVAASQTNRTAEITSLKVPGISGRDGNLLAIINNHTFAVGDEGDVLTPAGRVHLRCIEIKPTYVVVEVNGRTHRITLGEQ